MKTGNATPAGWQLEGNSADAYEEYLAKAFAPWAEGLLSLAGVQAGEGVLDVACGTGIVARRAASRVGPAGRIAGIDLNENMLAVARRVSAGVRPAIDWRQADAAALPFPASTFDVVCCEQAVQFLADPAGAVREMHRVLAPGGRAVASVCRAIEHSPVYLAMAESLERHVGPAASAVMRSPFSPWRVDQLRRLFADAGFSAVRVTIEIGALRYPSVEELLRREAASSPLAGPIAALGEQVRNALIGELTDAVRDYVDDDGVACGVETYVVLAYKAA